MNDKQESWIEEVNLDTPPWLQPVSEGYAGGMGRGKLAIIIAGGAITFLGLFGLALYSLYTDRDTVDPIYVQAPIDPVRTKPEDRGGLDVPHQDKQVFERGAGHTINTDAQLKSAAEQPVDRLIETLQQAKIETELSDAEILENIDQKPGNTPSNVPGNAAVTAAVSADKPSAAPAPKSDLAVSSPSSEQQLLSAGNIYQVQLGAYSSEENAAKAWKTLKQKYRRELDSLAPQYQSVETGDRTLYRLRVGPVHNRGQADELCLSLRDQGQACIVARP